MNDVSNLISTVGFPIAVSVGVGYILYKMIGSVVSVLFNKFIETLDKLTSTNEKLVETNHTFVLEFTKIKDDLNDVKTDVKEIKNIVEKR